MRRHVLLAALTALALFSIAVPSLARAQGERPSIEIARSHMEQGQAYYLQGRFGEAAAEFEAAYEAEPFSAFLYNAAVALENAGDPVRAVDFFARYLERDPNATDRAGVEERLVRLRAQIDAARAAAAARPEPGVVEGTPPEGTPTEGTPTEGAPTEGTTATGIQPLGTVAPMPDALPEDFKSLVSVRTAPEGATVVISNDAGPVARGFSPFSYTLDQGRYHVRIEHPDFNVAEQDIAIEPGKVYVVVVNLSQGEFLGYLRVVTSPPGAQVFIDDREAGPRGQTPFEGPLPTGTHHVWIERAGYAPVEQDAEVVIGGEVDLRLELERVAFGRVRVLGNVRGARVSIDGALVGAVPWEGDVPAGTRTIRVESDGLKAFERVIEVSRGQLTPVRVRLRPDVGRGGAWVAGAFALLSVGGGVAMALISDDMRQSLERDAAAGTLASNDERLDNGLYLTIGADAAFGLGVILGALSIYYFVYDPLPPSEGTALEPRDWAFAPFVDPRTGTVGGTLAGSF